MKFDVAVFLECLEMAGQVAISDLDQFFKVVEIHLFIYHECTHDPQPDTTVEYLIEMRNRIIHASLLSYFHHMATPYMI